MDDFIAVEDEYEHDDRLMPEDEDEFDDEDDWGLGTRNPSTAPPTLRGKR